jgi:uncharacterized protein YbjT (DUF2867 family)
MKNILLLGATGQLGRQIAHELRARGYHTRALVRDLDRAAFLQNTVDELIEADPTRPDTLRPGHFADIDTVISALGKSVSPNDRSRPTFREVDYQGNLNVLAMAGQHGVRKFIYVSAFHAEQFPRLEYFRVHADFSRALSASGLDYCICKPPALFSAYAELLDLARQGRLTGIGNGKARTNPIDEGDFARVVVDQIEGSAMEVAAGGKKIYTRREVLEAIQSASGRRAKIRQVPAGVLNFFLPVLRIMDRNLHDKLAFFTAVMEADLLAPAVGERTFESYLAELQTNGTTHGPSQAQTSYNSG